MSRPCSRAAPAGERPHISYIVLVEIVRLLLQGFQLPSCNAMRCSYAELPTGKAHILQRWCLCFKGDLASHLRGLQEFIGKWVMAMCRKMRKLSKTGPESLRATAKQLMEIWMELVKDASPDSAKRCEPTKVPHFPWQHEPGPHKQHSSLPLMLCAGFRFL